MSLKEVFAEGKFAITGEIGPPKGIDIKGILEEAEHYYKGKVNAVNVTDIQSSVMKLGSLPVCHLLKDKGIEPVFQMVCRDRNRLALQSDLLSAAVLGIENVLCLTGDHTSLGDHPQTKPVFDLDSVQLLQAAKGLEKGQDMVGNELQGSPKFFLGAVANPGVDPLEPQIMKMEKKVKAGARFFQTQAVYEPKKFEKFMKAVEYLKTPVMVGIVLLKSAGMARYMNKNVAGVSVPEELIKEIGEVSKEDRPQKSVEIAARLIKEMKSLCQGVHLMPLGWDKHVPSILDAVGLY
jgi:5,10-methylenetetrahydrofolate reductase